MPEEKIITASEESALAGLRGDFTVSTGSFVFLNAYCLPAPSEFGIHMEL